MDSSSGTGSQAGRAQATQGESLHTFLASLTVTFLIFTMEIAVFIFLRNRMAMIYHPRTFLVPEDERVEEPSPGCLPWIRSLFGTRSSTVIQKCGLDAYFFLRYLSVLFRVFGILSCVILPILLPLNISHGKGAAAGIEGLDLLSWTNVGLAYSHRYWAHLLMALNVVAYICYVIFTELQEYIRVRQWHWTSSCHDAQKTVLVTDIPPEWLSVDQLESLFGMYPKGIQNISINRDRTKLIQKVKERSEIVLKLEAAETDLIKRAVQAHSKQNLIHSNIKGQTPIEDASSPKSLWTEFLRQEDRQSMRLPIFSTTWMPLLSFLGKKVDVISHCREELVRLNEEIRQIQSNLEDLKLLASAFIEFKSPVGAHMACQSLACHIPFHLKSHLVSHETVVWESLSMKWLERYIRKILVISAVGTLILGWAVPVTFTGLLSQVKYLVGLRSSLDWIDNLPKSVLGVVQGVLPQALLTVLLILLPMILRELTNHQGLLSKTSQEQYLQRYYFTFLFLQVFLAVSLSSAITSVLQSLVKSTSSASAILAKDLPKASNYFFSYSLLQALSISAGALVQTGSLLNFLVLSPRDSTPRQKWQRQTSLPSIKWGTFYPVYTNLACIGLLSHGLLSMKSLTEV